MQIASKSREYGACDNHVQEEKDNHRILYAPGKVKNQGQNNQVCYDLEMNILFDSDNNPASLFKDDSFQDE
jgi:hypothetical protein